MAEKYFGQLDAKLTAPATGDLLAIEDSEDTKKIDYNALANAILDKLTTKTYTVAGGTNTLIAAIDALNSKTSAFQNIPPLSSVNVGGNKKLVLTMNAGSANYRGFLVLFVQGNTAAGNPQICMFSWGNGGTAVTVSHVLGANTVYDGATIDGSNTAAVKVSIPMVSYETISAFASANVASGVFTIENA